MSTEVLVPTPGSRRSPVCASTVDAVFLDVEAFQESMAASGLPPCEAAGSTRRSSGPVSSHAISVRSR